METQPQNARETAFFVLERARRRGWSDSALHNTLQSSDLPPRERALCSRICYGVIQNQMLLDFWISSFSRVPLEKLESSVHTALRMGMYQAAFMDRIPERAAVNESVELVKRNSRNPNSPSLTNGILRSFCRSREALPQPESLSVRYSHPQWLVDLLAQQLEESELERFLYANNTQPPTTVQINPLRTTQEQLVAELRKRGVAVAEHPWLQGCLELSGTGNLEQMDLFQQGFFYVQDAAARLSVLAAQPRPGEQVLDACAAPGGKTFAAAMEMNNQGRILACDIHAKKVQMIQSGAQRLGLSIVETQVRNAKAFYPESKDAFDLVIADVPCSGLGVIRKKPDIRLKHPDALEGLPAIQMDILRSVARYVRPGGRLLYATCTVLRRENEEIVEAFLRQQPDFTLEPFCLPEPLGEVPEGMITLWPHRNGTDGFFFARLRRANAQPAERGADTRGEECV